ncbi:MAG TPA: hypothetical protein VEX11_19790, partial [Acetobacteraceae bacterium]|nr:hypothetical protein [Acetobacteraceae bacterium]
MFEETGLLVALGAFLADVERSVTVPRYYLARRVGGTPAAMGWEAQAVLLLPRARLADLLNDLAEQPIVN